MSVVGDLAVVGCREVINSRGALDDQLDLVKRLVSVDTVAGDGVELLLDAVTVVEHVEGHSDGGIVEEQGHGVGVGAGSGVALGH